MICLAMVKRPISDLVIKETKGLIIVFVYVVYLATTVFSHVRCNYV